MVDFKKMKSNKKDPAVINPAELFRRMPKPKGVNNLYSSQYEVLSNWFNRREKKDTIIKLHTGGGKTMVGLLIAQSTINERGCGHNPGLKNRLRRNALMFSHEERLKAIQLFLKYDCSYAATVRKLGYPSIGALKSKFY